MSGSPPPRPSSLPAADATCTRYAFAKSTTSRDPRGLLAATGQALSRAKVSRFWRRTGQLGVEEPVHMHDEIAHLRIVHGALRRGPPGLVGLGVVRIDA